MIKNIEKEDIKKLAYSINLNIDKLDIIQIINEFNYVIEKMEKLKNIDTSNLKAMHYPYDFKNTFLREDDTSEVLPKKEILENAKNKNDDYVIINRVVK